MRNRLVLAAVTTLLLLPVRTAAAAGPADAGVTQAPKAELVSPAPSSTLTSTAVTFRWTGGLDVGLYWLNVGTAPGLFNLANINAGRAVSVVVTNLPSDGSTIYVRLHSHVGGSWRFTDYTLTSVTSAAPRRAELISPAPNSTLDDTTLLFRWTGGVGVGHYWLNVGTAPGTFDLVNRDASTDLSVVATGLPLDGSTLYVRLHSHINGAWQFNDYTLKAATLDLTGIMNPDNPPYISRPQILGLSDELTLTSTALALEWTGNQNVTACQLTIGTAFNASDLWSEDCTGRLTTDVWGLPLNGESIFVRLRSLKNGVWLDTTLRLVAPTPDGAPIFPAFVAPSFEVRARTTRLRWTGGIDASNFSLRLSRQFIPAFGPLPIIFNGPVSGLGVDVTDDSHWSGGQLTFDLDGASYQRSVGFLRLGSKPRAELTSPAPGSTLAATTVRFEWVGDGSDAGYQLCVGTLPSACDIFDQDLGWSPEAVVPGLPSDGRTVYVSLRSHSLGAWTSNDYTLTSTSGAQRKAELVSPAPMSTLTSSLIEFEWDGGVGPAQYMLHVGTSPGGSDLANLSVGTGLSAVVSGLPHDGRTLYVRLFSHLNGSWQYYDYTVQAATMIPQLAILVSPAPGSAVAQSTQIFKWTRGVGVAKYRLDVGTSPGGLDITSQVLAAYPDLGVQVFNIPINGQPLYVRLHSLIGGAWLFDDFVLQTSMLAQLITPVPDSTLTSSLVTFQWTPVSSPGGTALYWLNVGSTPGAFDLYNAFQGTSLSVQVPVPIDGRTLYVRLFTHLGSWQYIDYVLTAADIARLVSPAPGSTLSSTSATFQWTSAPGYGNQPATYWLYVGSSPGTFDLANLNAGTNLSVQVSGLPADGRTIYVRLLTNNGAWHYYDYVLTASGSLVPLVDLHRH